MEKKRVYVETTVISDVTALPARDIVLAARQIATRESLSVHLHAADAFGRRSRMTGTHPFDPVLEEMWAVKREIASEYPTLEAYFQSFLDEQSERERQGVKFVSFPPRHIRTPAH